MSIVFGIVCWISEVSQIPELERCLESVKDYRVILIDGKWYDMKGNKQTSLPLAIEIIDSYSNVERITAINRSEWENRNLYLERCKKDDILIWVDTDEWVVITEDFTQYLNDSPSFLVNFHDKRFGGACYQKRIIRYPSESRHKDRHNQIWYNDTEILSNPDPAPKGLTIYQDKQYRSPHKEKLMNIRNHLREFR